LLPKFDYYLDESDPDIVVLRRQEGSFVAAFSARSATKEGIEEAAKEDYAKLLVEAQASGSLVHLQERFWAMSCSAAYESAERNHEVFCQCS
jgi:hypothetical protein